MSVIQHDAPVSMLPATALAEMVSRTPELLRELGRCADRFTGRDLTALTQDVLDVLQAAEATVVALTRDALEQGVIDASTAAGPRDWIRRLSGGESIDDVLGPDARRGSGPLVDHWGDEATAVPETVEVGHRAGMPGLEPTHAGRLATVAQGVQPLRNAHLREALAGGDVSVTCAKTALQEVRRTQPALKGSTREQVLGYYLDHVRALPGAAVAKDVTALS